MDSWLDREKRFLKNIFLKNEKIRVCLIEKKKKKEAFFWAYFIVNKVGAACGALDLVKNFLGILLI